MRSLTNAFAIAAACALLSQSAQAQIVPSFTETFGGGTVDHASWTPMNAGSSLTLVFPSTDRDRMDGANDGYLLVERGVGVIGTYGATRSLGTVTAGDAGNTVSVDFAYERPGGSFGNLKALFLADGVVIAEGSEISVFSAGNDPSAAAGLYSTVMVRLACLITADDVGKELSLTIQYYDGSITQNRDLALDSVNFINPADAVELPVLTGGRSDVGGVDALEINYKRRVDSLQPPMQYLLQSSGDLTPWSWSMTQADEIEILPVDSEYEQVTERFIVDPSSAHFSRLSVENKRLGDPGVTFPAEKMDPNYPQMLEWQTAGVQGGIPLRNGDPVLRILDPTNSAGLNAAINEVSATAATIGGGTILLKNGIYTINGFVGMRSHVRLVGESRSGVELLITMQTSPPAEANAITFASVNNAGLANLTIRGGYGTPDPSVMENVKPAFMVDSVYFYFATNCWIDDVDIIDSGNHTISAFRSSHITVRGCTIDGAWNKGEGGRGYVNINSDHFLFVENHVRQLRHFGMQKQYCEYNVVFRNFIEQDVNFHDDDNGNNLVEGNRILLPTTLDPNWHAVMGPWSVVHFPSRNDNYVFNNKCVENNNGGLQSFSDSKVVYLGARNYEQDGNVFVTTNVLPVAGTLYPATLGPTTGSP